MEVRRARVLARLNTRGITTVQAIREMVQIVTGREGDVTEHFADYAFSVTVHLLFDTIDAVQPVVLENKTGCCS